MTEEEEEEEEQLKLGQGCEQRTQGVGHAIKEYAALLLGSEAKLGEVGEDTGNKGGKGREKINNLAIPNQK